MKLEIIDRSVTNKIYYVANLAAFLKSKGKTQADLARKFKFSMPYISDMANMKRPITKEIKRYLESL